MLEALYRQSDIRSVWVSLRNAHMRKQGVGVKYVRFWDTSYVVFHFPRHMALLSTRQTLASSSTNNMKLRVKVGIKLKLPVGG